jgi:hypothetical protein
VDIPSGCNPRVMWLVDVTVDVELDEWLPCVTICDFRIPNVPTRS